MLGHCGVGLACSCLFVLSLSKLLISPMLAAALPSMIVTWHLLKVPDNACAGLTPVGPHPNWGVVAFYVYSEHCSVLSPLSILILGLSCRMGRHHLSVHDCRAHNPKACTTIASLEDAALARHVVSDHDDVPQHPSPGRFMAEPERHDEYHIFCTWYAAESIPRPFASADLQ